MAGASRLRTLIGAVALAAGIGLALAPPASAGVKRWRFGTAHHLPDSRAARITDGDFFSGRARLIDNFAAASRQRFRNRRHGRRKRVYLIQGTLAIRNKPDYDVALAGCRMRVPKGAFMLLTTDSNRAFFPRPASHIRRRTDRGTIGLSLGPFTVSLPFPAFSYYESTSVAPNVGWSSLSSRVHNWSWSWDDGRPQDVLLGYAAYWAGSARHLRYRISCTVVTIHDRFHTSQATVRMRRTAPG